MDLLGGYSSSEEGDGIRQEDASPQQQPPQQPIQKLPAPNFDGEEEAFATDTSNNKCVPPHPLRVCAHNTCR